jgi:hypothetical protein
MVTFRRGRRSGVSASEHESPPIPVSSGTGRARRSVLQQDQGIASSRAGRPLRGSLRPDQDPDPGQHLVRCTSALSDVRSRPYTYKGLISVSESRPSEGKAAETMGPGDLRGRRGWVSRANRPVLALAAAKFLRPLVQPGTIHWSLLIGWPDDGDARSVASVLQAQTRVRP